MNFFDLGKLVVLASIAYYACDTTVMSDSEFDSMCKTLATDFDKLSELHQWQLESAPAIYSSGYHIKVTVLQLHAAEAYFKARGDNLTLGVRGRWEEDVMFGRWVRISDITYTRSG